MTAGGAFEDIAGTAHFKRYKYGSEFQVLSVFFPKSSPCSYIYILHLHRQDTHYNHGNAHGKANHHQWAWANEHV